MDSLEPQFYWTLWNHSFTGLSGITVLLDSLELQFYLNLWNRSERTFHLISENSDCSGSSEPKVNAHTLLLVFGCMQQIVSNTEDTGSPEYVSESHAGSVFESCQQSVQTAHALHRHGNGGTSNAFRHVPPSCQRRGHFQSRCL